MRSLLPLAFFFAAGLPGLPQTPTSAPPPELPKQPRAIVAAAAPYYDFSDPSLKPFHLKATYQLYDTQGNPTERGTWEYWRVSEKVSHSSWKRADATLDEWQTADGAIYRKQSGEKFRYFERNIAGGFFTHLPALSEVDSGKVRLDPDQVKIGSHRLPCVIAIQQLPKNEKPKGLPPRFTSYCFDPSTSALLLSASNSIATDFQDVTLLQKHYFAREVDVFAGGVKSFSMRIDTIDSIAGIDAAITPDRDAVQIVPPATKSQENNLDVDANSGRLVHQEKPDYPPGAKISRIQGVVVLGAIINKEGRVQDLEVLASPSPLLTKSAVDSVKQWVYKPYLVNGEPIEVDTTINVVFTLGGG